MTKKLVPISEQITPATYLQQAVTRIADIYNQIADSITIEDIDTLSVKEKINALKTLAYIHDLNKKKSNGNMNFININTDKASVDDLEASLLNINPEE